MAVAVNRPVSGPWLQRPQETTTGTRTLSGQSWKGRPSLSSPRQESEAREGESRSRKRDHRVSPGRRLRGKWGQLRKGQVRMEALPPGDTAPEKRGVTAPEKRGVTAPSCWVTTLCLTASGRLPARDRRPVTVWPGPSGPHTNIHDPAETSTFPACNSPSQPS